MIQRILAYGRNGLLISGLLLGLTTVISCKKISKNGDGQTTIAMVLDSNTAQFEDTMKKHLDAVSNRDLETLKSTLSPSGQMQLILPGTEIIEGVEGFMYYHREWFAAPDWTFETKIRNTEVGHTMGMAITEVVYREPERDGKPYFNRMIVSYDLKKIDGQWYVVKDHASSVEKSTDQKRRTD